jgi:DNA topoisomerase-2
MKRCLSAGNSEIKVFQLASYVAEHMNYHHGGASLEQTITKMAQSFVCANNFPILLPLSQFGSRFKGGKDHGAARYIKTKLNKDFVFAMFNSDDTYVLKHTYDEGVCNEPVHYSPVAPYVLMESVELPATGWKYEGYARVWSSIYANVKRMISLYDGVTVPAWSIREMSFAGDGWVGDICTFTDGKEFKTYSKGVYSYDEKKNNVTITELPFREWTESYIVKLGKMDYVKNVDDKSTKSQINLIVQLKPGAYRFITDNYGNNIFDAFEEYFQLKKAMGHQLNFINKGAVCLCKKYRDVIPIWFKDRYDTYVSRLKRMAEIIRLRIIFKKEIIRFVKTNKTDYSKLDDESSNQLLRDKKHLHFNTALLDSPKFTPIGKLEYLICDPVLNKKNGYRYLLKLNAYDRFKQSQIRRANELKKLEEEYDYLCSPHAVKHTWFGELEKLNDVINVARAHEKKWLCKERKANFKKL